MAGVEHTLNSDENEDLMEAANRSRHPDAIYDPNDLKNAMQEKYSRALKNVTQFTDGLRGRFRSKASLVRAIRREGDAYTEGEAGDIAKRIEQFGSRSTEKIRRFGWATAQRFHEITGRLNFCELLQKGIVDMRTLWAKDFERNNRMIKHLEMDRERSHFGLIPKWLWSRDPKLEQARKEDERTIKLVDEAAQQVKLEAQKKFQEGSKEFNERFVGLENLEKDVREIFSEYDPHRLEELDAAFLLAGKGNPSNLEQLIRGFIKDGKLDHLPPHQKAAQVATLEAALERFSSEHFGRFKVIEEARKLRLDVADVNTKVDRMRGLPVGTSLWVEIPALTGKTIKGRYIVLINEGRGDNSDKKNKHNARMVLKAVKGKHSIRINYDTKKLVAKVGRRHKDPSTPKKGFLPVFYSFGLDDKAVHIQRV